MIYNSFKEGKFNVNAVLSPINIILTTEISFRSYVASGCHGHSRPGLDKIFHLG